MRRTIHCKHYRAMSEHETCSADVRYDKFRGLRFEERPCFCRNGKEPNPGCDLAVFPTAEEIAEEDRQTELLFARTLKAREVIVNHLGGPWKRGMELTTGVIDCPICGGTETLRFSRSGYNGHIHAACSTDGCVSWME